MKDTLAMARARWQKDGAAEHLSRCFALLDRMESSQIIATNGSGAWSRYDPNVDATRSGNTSTNAARRAKGRKTQDEREYAFRLTILLQDWQITEGQVLAAYAKQGDAAEGFDPETFDSDDLPVVPETPTAPQPERGKRAKRDRLAWVPVMRELAARYAAQKAGAR